jgi:hypothetical protein
MLTGAGKFVKKRLLFSLLTVSTPRVLELTPLELRIHLVARKSQRILCGLLLWLIVCGMCLSLIGLESATERCVTIAVYFTIKRSLKVHFSGRLSVTEAPLNRVQLWLSRLQYLCGLRRIYDSAIRQWGVTIRCVLIN